MSELCIRHLDREEIGKTIEFLYSEADAEDGVNFDVIGRLDAIVFENGVIEPQVFLSVGGRQYRFDIERDKNKVFKLTPAK